MHNTILAIAAALAGTPIPIGRGYATPIKLADRTVLVTCQHVLGVRRSGRDLCVISPVGPGYDAYGLAGGEPSLPCAATFRGRPVVIQRAMLAFVEDGSLQVFYQTTARTERGDSGRPLLVEGKVVGICQRMRGVFCTQLDLEALLDEPH